MENDWYFKYYETSKKGNTATLEFYFSEGRFFHNVIDANYGDGANRRFNLCGMYSLQQNLVIYCPGG